MKERLYQGENDNEDEHHDYKTNYQHLQDLQKELASLEEGLDFKISRWEYLESKAK